MAQQQTVINSIRSNIGDILELIEDAQAKAAATVQEYNKLGGATFLSGFDWSGNDIVEQDLTDAVASLGTLFPDILSTHGTNLYKTKL